MAITDTVCCAVMVAGALYNPAAVTLPTPLGLTLHVCIEILSHTIGQHGKLTAEETDRFYRGSGQVTLSVGDNNGLLGIVYPSRHQNNEALQSALAQIRSDFPHAVVVEGSMRGHYFCEDLPDAGWRHLWDRNTSPARDTALKDQGATYEPQRQSRPDQKAGKGPKLENRKANRTIDR